MTTTISTRAYAVRAEYLSDGLSFAVETFTIEVVDGLDPYAVARTRANESVYTDPRIPDLTLIVTLESLDPEDPDPQTPSGALKPVCPRCGSEDLACDATARWDIESQSWDISGLFDCQTCDNCGAEGDGFARWVPAAEFSPSDRFMWALVETLQNPSLALDAAFQHFCLDAHDIMVIDQAAVEWRSRTAAQP